MEDDYLGTIRMTAAIKAPQGWLFCQGQLLNISQHRALHSLIGTQFGGDGITTFALPDFRGRSPIGAMMNTLPIPKDLSKYQIGNQVGKEYHQLTIAEMPKHNHIIHVQSGNGTLAYPKDNFLAGAISTTNHKFSVYADFNTGTQINDKVVQETEAGSGHPNMQAYTVINFMIRVSGMFPPKGD